MSLLAASNLARRFGGRCLFTGLSFDLARGQFLAVVVSQNLPEQYLGKYPGGVILVSRHRYLMDWLAHKVIEIDDGKASVYRGNYSSYLLQKQAALEKQERASQKVSPGRNFKTGARLRDLYRQWEELASEVERARSRI